MNGKPANYVRSGRWGLYRDTQRGWIAGVAAGIADRIGIKPLWVRLGFLALGLLEHGAIAIILYIVLALVLERRGNVPREMPMAAGYFADRFQTPPGLAMPNGGIAEASARFAALDARLNQIEAAVLSDDLSLRRKFRDLGG